MINFNFPDFIEGYSIYQTYFHHRDKNRIMFYEDSCISSIYGTFPNCVWNGGSCYIGGPTYSYDYMKNKIESFNEKGIAIRIIATNPLIEAHHLHDTYANLIMDAANNGFNEVVVCSSLLEDYLRDKYPNFKYVKSILASYEENKSITLDDKYYMSCMMRAANNNWNYLDKIPPEKRHMVEFLCTDPCPDNCPRIKTHYHQMAEIQLTLGKDGNLANYCSMNQLQRGELKNNYTHSLKSYINREQIIKDYVPRGFTNFKISGRFNVGTIAVSVAEYLVKPEYQSDWYESYINELSRRGFSGWVKVLEDL